MKKTNVERILEQFGIQFAITNYDASDGHIDGVSVAEKTGKAVETVFKTLVVKSGSGFLYVLLIPVAETLDLKKAARHLGEKKIEMIPVKDIQKNTGYIRGGCSPIGMKKKYKTLIHESAHELEQITVSAGKIGSQVTLAPEELLRATEAAYADLIM